jgi:hypothetical protein
MAELDDSTFEGRTICPKCGKTGSIQQVVERERSPQDRGKKTYSITCMTELCRWFGVNWLVDVNPDGSVPPVRPHQKAYPAMPDLTERTRAAVDAEIARSMGNNPKR